MTNVTYRLDIGQHDSEWLFVPMLSPSKFSNSAIVGRIACQMEAAQAFDRADLAQLQSFDELREWISRSNYFASPIAQFELRTANRARNRFGVKPSVKRVFILLKAGRAHDKARHGGLCPIVRHTANDRKPRSAICAIDKRIAIPSISRFEEFGETRGAGSHVGCDKNWIE
jgi:hypothetical protein